MHKDWEGILGNEFVDHNHVFGILGESGLVGGGGK